MLLESYRNVYRKSSACHDENHKKIDFLFHLKSKTNLVTLRKCYSHLKYYKIDLNFSMKLQEINLYVCEEYKTEREARHSDILEREA